MLEEGVWGRNLLKVSPRLARGIDVIDSIRPNLRNLVEAAHTNTLGRREGWARSPRTSPPSRCAPGITGTIRIRTIGWASKGFRASMGLTCKISCFDCRDSGSKTWLDPTLFIRWR